MTQAGAYRRIVYRDSNGNPTAPLPKQNEFHKSKSKFVVYIGGVGSGKTSCLTMDGINQGLKYAGASVIFFRRSYRKIDTTTRLEFFKHFGVTAENATKSPFIKYWNKNENYGYFQNDSLFRFLALDSLDDITSINASWLGIDEGSEFTKAAFQQLQQRVRGEIGTRQTKIVSNAAGRNWMWQLFHPESLDCLEDSTLIIAPSTENIYLPQDYLDTLKKTLPEAYYRRQVDGSFDDFVGLIYPEFSVKRHVKEFDENETIKPHWNKLCGLDWGYVNPLSAHKYAVDEHGTLWVVDEHYKSGWTPGEHAEVLSRWQSDGYDYFVCDPSLQKTRYGNRTVSDIFADYSLFMVGGNNDVHGGIMHTSGLIKQNKLIVHPRCTQLIRELQNYRWQELRDIDVDRKNSPEEPVKKDDHACDELRYIVNHIMLFAQKPFEMTAWEKERLENYLKHCRATGQQPMFDGLSEHEIEQQLTSVAEFIDEREQKEELQRVLSRGNNTLNIY